MLICVYRVIYNVIEEIESAMKGLLDPEFEEQVIGQAKFVKHSKFLKLVLLLDVMLLKVKLREMLVYVLFVMVLFNMKAN
ncbi:hypothetical protein ACVPOR_04510 [Staphylococcus aureus]